jgi:DNA helicase HerA-like ATPase
LSSIVEQVAALAVGTVEFVAPDEIKVILDTDAPQATALNTGVPSRFPRLNGFVLIPNEAGAVVGLVSWLGIERSAYPKRTGLRDFGLIDLPFPLRKMSLNPVGTLRARGQESGETGFVLDRGVAVFPSVGDPVLLPTPVQLRAIVEASGVDKRLPIGTSPLLANAEVSVDPDKLFGRHLAILGNTGSGKSCTVAGLVRWSLETARATRTEAKRAPEPNARFIVLDPNGEYLRTFADFDGVRVFQVTPEKSELDSKPLTVPAWMWNSHEWTAFAQAAPGAQRPLLLQGLRGMRSDASLEDDVLHRARILVDGYRIWLRSIIGQGPAAYGGDWGTRMNRGGMLRNLAADGRKLSLESEELNELLDALVVAADELASAKVFDWKGTEGFNAFQAHELEAIDEEFDAVIDGLPASEAAAGGTEDAPTYFDVSKLPAFLEALTRSPDFAQAAQFAQTLNMRIKGMLNDRRLGPIVNPDSTQTLEDWLTGMVGGAESDGQVSVVDLSLVPADVLHVIIAVIGRVIFESLQRYRKIHSDVLPTVLVLEEAHSFIRRHRDEEGAHAASAMCRETFERIAREGRKFGLGLVLSSQRPSELSPTVLAQCNTFLLHRIVNDRDQELVSRLVPDNLGGLLRDLPNLPSRQAILLGWATPVPVLVEIRELAPHHRPQSADPDYWEVWTGDKLRPAKWTDVAADWGSGP